MAEQPKKITGGAFGRYMNENRAALLKENSGKPATESIKLGSARFKALDASAKVKYEKMYTEAKAKYEKDLAAFLAGGGEMKAKKEKKGKKEKKFKDPNKPKQPAGGAFGCYLSKNRPELAKACAGKPVTAVTQLASTRWKELSATAKIPYEKDFAEKKAQFEKEMKSYVPPAKEEEDEVEEDEDEDDEEEKGESKEEEKAPKKRKGDAKADAPAAKKGKSGSVSAELEAEAKKLGLLIKLKGLVENPKVNCSASDILAALQKSNGSVVAAKKSLFGA